MNGNVGLIAMGTLITLAAEAQNSTVIENGAMDLDKHLYDGRAIPQPSLREADVAWSKRIWRIIDVREKLNQPLYYPLKPLQERKSLFDVLKDALLANNLTAYDNPIFDEEFTVPMLPSQVASRLVQWDSTNTTPDPDNPDIQIPAPIKKEIASENVKQYLVKEDWFFDKQRSVLDVRIIGICPLAEYFNDAGDFLGYRRLFWIYFPEARNVLIHHRTFTRTNYATPISFDDIFIKRMFSSVIVKESNVFDRSIIDYKSGLETLLEAEKIKVDISNWESDLWHY